MKQRLLLIAIGILISNSLFGQSPDLNNNKWAFEVNLLWPVFPGNIYSARVLRQVYSNDRNSGDAFIGFAHKPYEYRETEGYFSYSAVVFGYRQYIWKGLNAEFYNALGPGRIRDSVVNGEDYNSIDYEIGLLMGYRIHFLQKKKTPLYVNLMPLGFAYVAAQSNPHPIVGQTEESAIYFGKIQLGIRF